MVTEKYLNKKIIQWVYTHIWHPGIKLQSREIKQFIEAIQVDLNIKVRYNINILKLLYEELGRSKEN